jgi:hypothetical protein
MELAQLKKFEEYIKTKIPGFEIRYKNQNTLQKIIGFLLFFNRGYMTQYITTMYPYVYFPSKESYEENPTNSFMVLAHEYVHLQDDKNNFWFKFSYLLPQIIGFLLLISSLISLFFSWIPFVGLLAMSLICLLPLASPYRVHWEKRGYTMTIVLFNLMFGINIDIRPFLLDVFLGWAYYRMSWNEKDINNWYDYTINNVNEIIKEGPYKEVYEFLKNS